MSAIYVIDFAAPMLNLEGEFNTVRLGGKFSRCLVPGNKVMMVERPASKVIGVAEVIHVEAGRLPVIADQYAAQNHNQQGLDAEGAPGRLMANMIKRYGPHKCTENSLVTVISLKRVRKCELSTATYCSTLASTEASQSAKY